MSFSSRCTMIRFFGYWIWIATTLLHQYQGNVLFSDALPMAYVPAAVPFFEGRISNSTYDVLDVMPIDIWYPVESNFSDINVTDAFETSGIDDIDGIGVIQDLIDLIIESIEDFNFTLPNSTDFGNFTIPTNITEFCGMIPEELCDLIERPPVRNGTYPLIVYSHDDGTLGAESVSFLSSLAALGFFVVATNHIGNTGLDDFDDSEDVRFFNRPRDVSAVIDYMLTNSSFADSIDDESIGVMGRGHGGLTAYAMAGGYEDFSGDDRVKAIVSVAGLSTPMTDSEIENIDIPLLLLGGTLDTVVPIENNTVRIWENSNSGNAYRVDVEGAVHNSFTSICGLLTVMNTTLENLPENITDSSLYDILLDIQDEFIDYGDGVCSDTAPEEVLDFNVVQTISLSYINSFFKVFLDDGGSAFQFVLTPAYARLLPVVFDRRIITESPTPVPTESFSPTRNPCGEDCATDNSQFRCLKLQCRECPFCAPTTQPTDLPTANPTTAAPTSEPTGLPTATPTTTAPTSSTAPTIVNTFSPSASPTSNPTKDQCPRGCRVNKCDTERCSKCSFCPSITLGPSVAPTLSSSPTAFVTSSPTDPNAAVMKVDRIKTQKRNKIRGKYEINIKLWIADGDDDKLSQTTVVMLWQTATESGTIEEITSNSGQVTFKFPKFDNGETVSVSLVSMTKEGYEYRPNENIEEDGCPVFSTDCPTQEFS